MELPSLSTNCCNIYISLTISESVKYLGVEIDNKLRFKDHTDAKVSKARQRLYLVKQFKFLGTSDRFLNQIFSAYVESCFLSTVYSLFFVISMSVIRSQCGKCTKQHIKQ